jgi:hypothetical protein
VCDACQRAKSHQLPYNRSTRVSSFPLELVHSDVWGPAIASSSGFKYYVSFVDDFSRYTWIYLIKHKSDVEQIFYDFQHHVERLLDTKIRAIQSDWAVIITVFIIISNKPASPIEFPAHTPPNKMASPNENIGTSSKQDLPFLPTHLFLFAIGMKHSSQPATS